VPEIQCCTGSAEIEKARADFSSSS